MSIDLNNQSVLVIGATGGIGRATAKLFEQAGARVTAAGRAGQELDTAAKAMRAEPANLDFTDDKMVEAFFAERDTFDHVVVAAASTKTGSVGTLALADAYASMNSKFFGAYRIARAAKIRDGGSLTFVSGFLSNRPSPTSVLQGAINAALEALARGLALERAPVRVNTVSPGLIDTPLYAGMPVADRDGRRPVRPGDVMVLVRSRNSVFEAVIRACKERGVPVAGADRLALTGHIAVMDLVAAGRAALSPADDFTLACVLKSPLIGLSDDDLIALAPRRRGTLVAALGASEDPRHRAAHARIEAWRADSAWATPFAFYTRLLGADGGRRRLLGRLGPEAGDAIDEFVALTLAHERDGAPSLMAFLARLDGAELSVKRDMEAAGDAVRVMTVHAAKGLEARIVYLPDTCSVPSGRHDPSLFGLEDRPGSAESGLLAWSPRGDADPGRVAEARALGRQRAAEEHNRLLYVAMTRAEERLTIAGFCGEKGPPEGCWYAMVEAAGLPLEPAPAPWDPRETVSRMEDPVPGAAPPAAPRDDEPEAPPLPDWLFRRPAEEAGPDLPPVRPSNALGAADQLGPVAWPYVDRTASRARKEAAAAGRLMHRLLQHLPDVPRERRAPAAARFLAAQGAALGEEARAALAAQALAVLDDPALAPLFGPDSRAEVAVTASVGLPSGRRVDVTGQIDRIGVGADVVHIADFKTGAPGAVTPRQVLQLALYRAAVEPLYPDHRIRTHLVWTASGEVVEVSAGECANALETMG